MASVFSSMCYGVDFLLYLFTFLRFLLMNNTCLPGVCYGLAFLGYLFAFLRFFQSFFFLRSPAVAIAVVVVVVFVCCCFCFFCLLLFLFLLLLLLLWLFLFLFAVVVIVVAAVADLSAACLRLSVCLPPPGSARVHVCLFACRQIE